MPAVLYYSFPPAKSLTGNEIIGPVLQNGSNVTVTIEDIASLAAADFSNNSGGGGVLNAASVNISGPLTVGGALSGATADFSGNVTVGGVLSLADISSAQSASVTGALTAPASTQGAMFTWNTLPPSVAGGAFQIGTGFGSAVIINQYGGGVGGFAFFDGPDGGPWINTFRVDGINTATAGTGRFSGGLVTKRNTLDDGNGNATVAGALNVTDEINLYPGGLPTVGGSSGLVIGPTVSGQAAALFVNAPTSYPNDLLSVGVDGTPVGSIDQYGNLTIKGSITSNGVTQGSSSLNISGLPASITNTTGTTLSASDMINGAIIRTGPTSDFSDTTDTAANIIASFGPSPPVGSSYQFALINQTDYSETLTPGAGVTITGSGLIATNNALTFRVTITDTTSGAQAVTLTRLFAGGT